MLFLWVFFFSLISWYSFVSDWSWIPRRGDEDLNWWSSCLYVQRACIIDIRHHTQFTPFWISYFCVVWYFTVGVHSFLFLRSFHPFFLECVEKFIYNHMPQYLVLCALTACGKEDTFIILTLDKHHPFNL